MHMNRHTYYEGIGMLGRSKMSKRLRKIAAVVGPTALAVGGMIAYPYIKNALMKRGMPEAEADTLAKSMSQGRTQVPPEIKAELPPEAYEQAGIFGMSWTTLALIGGAGTLAYFIFGRK